MKAYQLKKSPTDGDVLICPMCEEESDMETRSGYRHRRYDIMRDDSDHYYFDTDCEEVTLYFCDNCDEWTPDTPGKQSNSTWVCGECGYRTRDEEEAMRCCL